MNTKAELKAIEMVANLMCASIRTAPKTRGIDNIKALIVKGAQKNRISKCMREIAITKKKDTFLRDSICLDKSALVLLVGTKVIPVGLTVCGLCGFKDCQGLRLAKGVCSFSALDLGIAVGSAVAIASDLHIDNRIMYSAGLAALELAIMGRDTKFVIAIPLSVTGKNIFFDRTQ